MTVSQTQKITTGIIKKNKLSARILNVSVTLDVFDIWPKSKQAFLHALQIDKFLIHHLTNTMSDLHVIMLICLCDNHTQLATK